MRILNPTYISFVNDHEIDPWEIESDKIRWGFQFPIGDKWVTTWRMKKNNKELDTTIHNTKNLITSNMEQTGEYTKIFPNKNFPVSGEWFPV